jgi:hypothetical protein
VNVSLPVVSAEPPAPEQETDEEGGQTQSVETLYELKFACPKEFR